MAKQNKRGGGRIGQGMKPRQSATGALAEAAGTPTEVSAGEGQEQGVPVPVEGVEVAEQNSTTLEPGTGENGVQNLESAESETVALPGSLEELMRKSRDGDIERVADSIMSTLGRAEQIDHVRDHQPPHVEEHPAAIVIRGNTLSTEDLAAFVHMNGKIEYHPPEHPHVGQREDGTFGVVVTLAEGLIEPIGEQAAADKITVEEWLNMRLAEYLETWWQPAKSR